MRLGWEQSETDGKDLLEASWQEELGGRCVFWLHCSPWHDSKALVRMGEESHHALPASGSVMPRCPSNKANYFSASMLFNLKKCSHTLYSTPNISTPILHIEVIFLNYLIFFIKIYTKVGCSKHETAHDISFLSFKHCLGHVHLSWVKCRPQGGKHEWIDLFL